MPLQIQKSVMKSFWNSVIKKNARTDRASKLIDSFRLNLLNVKNIFKSCNFKNFNYRIADINKCHTVLFCKIFVSNHKVRIFNISYNFCRYIKSFNYFINYWSRNSINVYFLVFFNVFNIFFSVVPLLLLKLH